MLELKNISFEVTEDDKDKGILRDINLTIDNNKFVVITGPNGGGKSTLAKIIAGIEKPTKGQIVLDLIRLASGTRMSVATACQYLSAVGLCAKDYINREVNASLSGGELKRIEIATVLARKTRLSLFDEPEAGIDLWSFQNLIQVFEVMRASIQDSSILIISHQERILEIADEIVVIADGRIDRQGPKADILPTLIGTASAVPSCKVVQ